MRIYIFIDCIKVRWFWIDEYNTHTHSQIGKHICIWARIETCQQSLKGKRIAIVLPGKWCIALSSTRACSRLSLQCQIITTFRDFFLYFFTSAFFLLLSSFRFLTSFFNLFKIVFTFAMQNELFVHTIVKYITHIYRLSLNKKKSNKKKHLPDHRDQIIVIKNENIPLWRYIFF